MTKNIIWLRHETRETERRTPLLPEGAKSLIKSGHTVIVERSPKRITSDKEYAEVGCHMVASGSWVDAPKEAFILGLKELPPQPEALKHTHIYFAHAFKEQSGWRELLTRFESGGGSLLDIEYMVDQKEKRVVAFGYWAGYMGAALSLIQWHNKQSGHYPYLDAGLKPFKCAGTLDTVINTQKKSNNLISPKKPRVLIIGANGRCGQGALDILRQHDVDVTCWGRDKTNDIDRAALLSHDILINCAFIIGNVPAFLRQQDISEETKLSVIADVSCDPYSAFNPIPLYHNTTSWNKPYITVDGIKNNKVVDIIAIDNLPSLLPKEASQEFSELLLPHLMTLTQAHSDPVWASAHDSYCKAIDHMENELQNMPKQAIR